ncbi:MAG: phytanoyl-CoA dioxygenase family protein [bacterium]|nr:phytanoyl-CoA dioxygenase family protein [bacterium]
MVILSEDDIRHFKREGYLIKRGVLDPDLMARARARLWDGAPPSRKRDDPETWVGPFTPEEENRDGSNARRGYRWNFREPGGEDFMVRLLAKDPSVYGMAEQLLGKGKLIEPERIRGIYCTMPYDVEIPERPPGCHVDAHPFHFGVVGYIDFVPPGGGGFTVWPKSHRSFYYDFYSQHKIEPTGQYDTDRETIGKEWAFADCHGAPGDIVFWHHRIGHTASPNGSRQIRQAVLYDFRKKDLVRTMEEPPCEDMWRDWSDAVREMEE